MTAPARYRMAIDWTDGRTPTYETYRTWLTTEADARRYFARDAHGRAALVGPSGLILATVGDR